MNINHLPTLNREMRVVLAGFKDEVYPKVIHFHKGMGHPQFKITIEKIEVDTFVDSLGQKWKKIE